jgi:hypothetical protein
MLGTDAQLKSLIRRLGIRIAALEQSASRSGPMTVLLEELSTQRQSLRLVLINRRVEAAKPVVDYQKWRDGDGALYLCFGTTERRRSVGR